MGHFITEIPEVLCGAELHKLSSVEAGRALCMAGAVCPLPQD